MGKANSKGSIELEVKNFGPIVEAKVDLRPFTLFVGPSNTGKSYLAVLIYALHRIFGAGHRFRRLRHITEGFGGDFPVIFGTRHGYRQLRRGGKSTKFLEENLEILFDWIIQTSPKGKKEKLSGKSQYPLPEKIASLIRRLRLFDPKDGSGNDASGEILRCFGVDSASQLIRIPGAKNAKVVLRRHVGEDVDCKEPFAYELHLGTSPSFTASIPESNPLRIASGFTDSPWISLLSIIAEIRRRQRESEGLFPWWWLSRLMDELLEIIFPYVVGHVSRPAHYLPADRAGVMHVHRTVVSALVEQATSVGIRQEVPTPMLSGVLADFLKQLIDLDDISNKRGIHMGGVAAEIEKAMLRGSVRSDASAKTGASYPVFSYLPRGWKEDQNLPLMNVSSMVSELAPVVLYLRHVVRPGDVLIIEEPEAHLHPAMQVEFTRQLAAAVKAGVRVIATTHSEWILEELANLVRISGLSEADRKDISGGIALESDEVGAWLFQPKERPKGSVVREISLDVESGTFAAGYDDVAADLHNRWADIESRLKAKRRR